jgi:hypothetical protein
VKEDYLSEKAHKKRISQQAMWALLIFIALFILIIVRFAFRPDAAEGFFSKLPSGDDAFEIARDYIKPTLKSPDVEFADGIYRYAKASDSVYVVKSYFETKNTGNRKVKTNFTITIKYNGGANLNERNWSLLSLEEN